MMKLFLGSAALFAPLLVSAAETAPPAEKSFAANAASAAPPLFRDGTQYRLDASPGLISDIVLERGETLVSVAAGDTSRWVIGDTTSGSGADLRTHVLVKPTSAGLTTNIIITTNRRTYRLLLSSRLSSAPSAMEWSYAAPSMVALRGPSIGEPSKQGQIFDVARLNFDYRIEGAKPAWRPVRAFDDGGQVFIEFPVTFSTGSAPPLFIIGEAGRPELVNYRQKGRFYIVDRLFERAELRLGEKKAPVVTISKIVSPPARQKGAAR